MAAKTWLITGISSGLGHALAKAAIDAGDFVIGTFRNQNQVNEFNRTYAGKALGVKMDVTNREEVMSVIEEMQTKIDRLDVVVNNAGFGFAGAIEEATIEETRAVMEANFFGALHVIQSVLPMLRKQHYGHIIQISSHGGFKATAGFGIYNASKFALEGMSEALAGELQPLGIRLTIVEPGPFRTSFAGSGFRLANREIEDYQSTAGLFRERIKSVDGKQEGDPHKAALAIISVVNHSNPPLRLPLGKVALATISSKLSQVQQDIDNWSNVAEGAVYE